MTLAIFGGTFDPVHKAHITVALEAADAFHLSRVLFVPAARPPHKTGSTCASFEDRFRMVELACASHTRFEPSRLEEGAQKSYSIVTIERVREQTGEAPYFIIGADAFAEIATWHRWPDVVAAAEFIVVTRPGHEYSSPPEARVHRLDTLALPVSSSDIRRTLAEGRMPEDLPPAVARYIVEHGLYGWPGATRSPQA